MWCRSSSGAGQPSPATVQHEERALHTLRASVTTGGSKKFARSPCQGNRVVNSRITGATREARLPFSHAELRNDHCVDLY